MKSACGIFFAQAARKQAQPLLRRQPIERTMLLEDQRVEGRITDEQVDDVLRDTNPRRFWD